MVDIIRTRIEGARELDNLLTRLPKEVARKRLVTTGRKGANKIRKEAKQRVARRTGELDRNLVSRKQRSKQATVVFRIGVLRRAFWGMFEEFGTANQPARPFLRPAADVSAGPVIETMGRDLGKGIEQDALRLAGPFAKSGLARRRRR